MRRLLVVGAGASYSETKAAGLPDECRLPVMSNFAAKTWRDYNPHVLLSQFFAEIGIPTDGDLRELFIQLERTRPADVNVEKFFEFAFQKKAKFPSEWANLLYHGILNPIIFLLSQGLWKSGILDCPLTFSPKVASQLLPGDAVVDLNYDTLFEIGVTQARKDIVFLPNAANDQSVLIAKPHGSFNLVVNETERSFKFGKLDWPGSPQPADGSLNFVGFIPPRLNKSYTSHPVAKMILAPLRGAAPQIVTFWGVGFTASDHDLNELYRQWCCGDVIVEIINPSAKVAEDAKARFANMRHFKDVDAWLESLPQ